MFLWLSLHNETNTLQNITKNTNQNEVEYLRSKIIKSYRTFLNNALLIQDLSCLAIVAESDAIEQYCCRVVSIKYT